MKLKKTTKTKRQPTMSLRLPFLLSLPKTSATTETIEYAVSDFLSRTVEERPGPHRKAEEGSE